MKKFKIKNNEIKTRLTFLFVNVTLIVSIIIGILGMLVTSYSTNSAVKKNLAELPYLAAMAAQNSISTYTYTIGEIATDSTLTDPNATDEERTAFAKAKAASYYMRTGGFADRNGYDSVNQKDFSKEAFFQSAISGTSYMSTPYVNDTKDDSYMVVSAPVISNDEIIGIVYFHCDTILLQTIVADLQVGDNGFAYILDKNGTVIACTDQSKVFNQTNIIQAASTAKRLKTQAAIEQLMISGNNGIGSYSSDSGNILQGYAPIPGTDGWSVAIAISQEEFMRPALIGNIVQVLVVILCVLAVIYVSKKIAHAIADPIVLCAGRLQLLSEGDLTSPVPVISREDEIGILSTSTAHLVHNFSKIVEEFTTVLSSIADGDLTQKEIAGEFPGSFAILKEHLLQINSKLNQTISGIAEASEQVAESAGHVAATSHSLSEGAIEQEKTVVELSSTVVDIINIGYRTSELTEQARASAENAGEHLIASNQHITRLNDAMENITVSSAQISEIINTIESIASRTNMLALNASIEASRAGETGKGFAVVATEIGNLATQSAQAVKATKELINNSMSAVDQGTDVVTKVTASLSEVISLASDSVSKMKTVAEAVVNQTETIQKITTNTDRISNVVKNTSAKADEGVETSRELFHEADELKELVHGFTLN